MRQLFVLLLCAIALGGCPVSIQISNITDLQKIGNDPAYPLDGEYEITGDIDASATSTWNGGEGFAPIGSHFTGYGFVGKINGNFHSISGLVINRPSKDYVGLFDYVGPSGEISSVKLVDCDVSGNTCVGAVVAFSYGLISGCSSSGTVTGVSNVGGIVGTNGSGAIARTSCSTCDVTGTGGGLFIGGFAGSNPGGTIENCYAKGDVTGVNRVGGFVGGNSSGTTTNSYSTGSASGTTNVGGFAGSNGTSPAGTISGCYWDTESSGNATSAGGTGKTTAQMMDESTFADWNFDTVWDIGTGYPFLHRMSVVLAWTLDIGIAYDVDTHRIVFTGTANPKKAVQTPSDNSGLSALTSSSRVLVGYNLTRTAGSFRVKVGSKYTTAKTASGYHYEVLENTGTGNIEVHGDASAAGSVDDVQVWQMAATDVYGPDRPFILDLAHRGDSGFYETPWSGAVNHLKPLNDICIAYCDDGVAALIPASDPFPTFGFRHVTHPLGHVPAGLSCRTSVAGNDFVHAFIDKAGVSWRLKAGLELDRLDRSWVFSDGTDHLVTFDPVDNTFYVAMLVDNDLKCVAITRSGGISYVSEAPTSLVAVAGVTSGIVSPISGVTFLATTDTLDMGVRARKTVDRVEVGASDVSKLKASILSKDGASWRKTIPVPVANDGFAYPVMAATDVRIQLTGEFGTNGSIDRIAIRFKQQDGRTG